MRAAAILAASGGVTRGVRAFASGKALEILDLPALLTLASGDDPLVHILPSIMPEAAV